MDLRDLREATRAEHDATEALMPLMGPELTRGMYVAVLGMLYPLVLSWEEWAAVSAPEGLRGLVGRRRRVPLLAADLAALGAKPDAGRSAGVDWNAVLEGPNGHPKSDPDRVAAFLGALYVMEGSTLGGRYIARHDQDVLGLEPGVGNAYFRGHGEATGALWREVQEQISAVREDRAGLVIGAARRAFAWFGEVLRAGETAAEPVQS